MKLLRIKLSERLKEPFRSLHPGFEISFTPDLTRREIEPVGLAGLNGSGKSNLLELISEIFYYLDSLQLNFPTSTVKEDKSFGFEIDYALPLIGSTLQHVRPNESFLHDDNYFIVRIVKDIDVMPTYRTISVKGYQEERDKLAREEHLPTASVRWNEVQENVKYLLPNKILAYTSGQNELLSNAFYKMQFHYFNDYTKQLKQATKFHVDNSRLFFSDNQSNASIFIANYLLGDSEALDVLNQIIKIERLYSFRITIRYANFRGKEVIFNRDLEMRIKRLKNCATTLDEKGSGSKKILTLDYLVQEATKEAFRRTFGDAPFELYKTLYELEMLNFYAIPEDVIEMVSNGPKWLNITDELPKTDPTNLLFRIEKIMIYKQGSSDPIYYKGLSDGEHQVLQVVGMVMMMEESGCLFLFDEPDTHYNPLWRSKLVNTINKVVRYRTSHNEARKRLQEIVITTHSPFVLSDMRKENVYVFEKPANEVTFKECPIETYGASSGIILDAVFGKEETISEKAKSELDALFDNINNLNDIKRVVEQLNIRFGESVEKLDKFSLLSKLKRRFEREK